MYKLFRKILCIVVISPILTLSVSAKDQEGQFAIRGAGLLTCDIYRFEKMQKSQLYFMTAAWVDGYVTAANENINATYDLMSFEKTELLMGIIAEHCIENPKHTIFSVISDLSKKLYANRIINKSTLKEITQGEHNASIYEVTLVKIQEKLRAKGFYSGPIDGIYSDITIKGIKSFQQSIAFETTGFPDQVTLWRLLR